MSGLMSGVVFLGRVLGLVSGVPRLVLILVYDLCLDWCQG